MIIDIHAHAYRMRPPGYVFCEPKELLKRYDELKIDKGVLLPIVNSEIYMPQAVEDILEICDAITDETLNDQYWVLLDKKGNEIDSTDIFDTDGRFMASGEYIIKVETEKNLAYSITLA